MDLPLPAQRERLERLEDAVRPARHMRSGDASPSDGHHVHAARPVAVPASATRPSPPILTGGGGATVRHELAVLDRHCAAVGRPPGAVQRLDRVRPS